MAYKNVTVKIDYAKDKEEFENFNFQPSDGGKFTVLKAIQLAQNKHGGNLEITSSRGLFLINITVSHIKEDNEWITPYLKKKGIEVK